jgi:hypothetical protein
MNFLIIALDTVQNFLCRYLKIISSPQQYRNNFTWQAKLKPVTGFAKRPLSGTLCSPRKNKARITLNIRRILIFRCHPY